jgi:hypothetical protein
MGNWPMVQYPRQAPFCIVEPVAVDFPPRRAGAVFQGQKCRMADWQLHPGKWASKLVALLALGITLQWPASVTAGELGHYGPSVADIRDYVMPPEPGFYAKLYTYYYTTETFKDGDGEKVSSITGPLGNEIDLDIDVDLYVVAPAFMWLSDWTILGARYGAYILPTFGNTSVGASLTTVRGFGVSSDESDFGVGDLFVQPLWLGWTRTHWDFALGYGFYAPIGEYEEGATDNIGLGFWEHQIQGAVAWYPDEKRGTAVVLALTYEFSQDIEGVDVTPGQRLSVNLGVDQFLPLGESGFLLELGAGIYGQFQTTDDEGSDARNPDVHDRIFGVGPQIGLTYVPWNAAATFKWMREFETEDRFEGDNFTLNFGVAF